MALVRASSFGSPRRQGKTKGLEQAGDWPLLMEHLIKLSEAHGAHETAAELRAQTKTHIEDEPEPEAPVRIRKRKKKPAPSSPDKKLRDAWRAVDEKRGRVP
jgi:hypothetical protein